MLYQYIKTKSRLLSTLPTKLSPVVQKVKKKGIEKDTLSEDAGSVNTRLTSIIYNTFEEDILADLLKKSQEVIFPGLYDILLKSGSNWYFIGKGLFKLADK